MDRKELFDKIEAGALRLSFTALKKFSGSPRDFVEYKTAPRPGTRSMDFGAAVHCLILEGEDVFFERFAVAPECDRRTKAGRELYNTFISEAEGKTTISASEMEKAETIKAAIFANESAMAILSGVTETEKYLMWDFEGYPFHGYADAVGFFSSGRWSGGFVLDLKIYADASPRKVKKEIRFGGVDTQLAGYVEATGAANAFVIAADHIGNVGVYAVGPEQLNEGRKETSRILSGFERCRVFDAWDQSYDFWAPGGVYIV